MADASAVLAYLQGEPGGDWFDLERRAILISAVNATEVITKLIDRGLDVQTARTRLADLRLSTLSFDADQSAKAADLRVATRAQGLSLGDRCCLALAVVQQAPVITADRPWAALKVGVAVELIR